jgi:oligopeptide/dipeptide ABC transporter ATP-binding protein
VELELGTIGLCDADALRAELGRRIGVVLQNPFTSFDPLKSVGSQIVEGVVRRKIMSRPEAEARARELLSEMGFADDSAVLRLFPHQLSGGMAQRISIAMAVMPQPAVVLADEPTSALDATLRTGVLELLRRFIESTGAVLVLVSHDLGLIAGFCQALIVMYGGRVVESGPATDLLSRPTHPYTKALVDCTPNIGGDSRRRLASIPGSAVSLFAAGEGCRYAPRCPFVMDVCHTIDPPLQAFGGTQVACHLVDKAADKATGDKPAVDEAAVPR